MELEEIAVSFKEEHTKLICPKCDGINLDPGPKCRFCGRVFKKRDYEKPAALPDYEIREEERRGTRWGGFSIFFFLLGVLLIAGGWFTGSEIGFAQGNLGAWISAFGGACTAVGVVMLVVALARTD